MTPDDRYDVSDLPEAQFEPGSDGQVLKNRLGIISKQEMDAIEARALGRAMDVLIRTYGESHRFTAEDIQECHRIWLGDLYEWAGQYQQNKGVGSLFSSQEIVDEVESALEPFRLIANDLGGEVPEKMV